MVQKYAKHTGYSDLYIFMSRYLIRLLFTCTFYIYSRLPRPGTMNEMDTVHQEPEGMVQY